MCFAQFWAKAEIVDAKAPIQDLLRKGDASAALALADATLARFPDDCGVPWDLASVSALRGQALERLGRDGDAAAAYTVARDRYDFLVGVHASAPRGLAQSLVDLARCRLRISHRDAFADADRATAVARDLDDLEGRALLFQALELRAKLHQHARRDDEATADWKTAVTVARRLAAEAPARFVEKLAAALLGLADVRRDDASRDHGIVAAEEAIALLRGLEGARPRRYTSLLAEALTRAARVLVRLGRREEALVRIDEAIAFSRAIVPETDALAHRVRCLEVRASILTDLQRHEDAVSARTAVVEACRARALATRSTIDADELAHALVALAAPLAAASRADAALRASEEAVVLARHQLAGSAMPPRARRVMLAIALEQWSLRLHDVQRSQEALAAAREALTLLDADPHAEGDPPASLRAQVLMTLSGHLATFDRHPEAAAANASAIVILRTLTESDPRVRSALAQALYDRSTHAEGAAGEAAIAALEEAIVLRRSLTLEDPEPNAPLLATTYDRLAAVLRAVGRAEDADHAAREAASLRRGIRPTGAKRA